MDTASCRVMPPASFSRFMKSWRRPSAAILRSCVRLASSCHASLAGYHGIAVGGFSTSPLTCQVHGGSGCDGSASHSAALSLQLGTARQVSIQMDGVHVGFP